MNELNFLKERQRKILAHWYICRLTFLIYFVEQKDDQSSGLSSGAKIGLGLLGVVIFLIIVVVVIYLVTQKSKKSGEDHTSDSRVTSSTTL